MQPRVLIITGYGLNCEAESRYAWEKAGASVCLVHFHDVLARPALLHDFGGLMFIGGFSYGDHMGSGHVFGLRVRHRLREDLAKFVAEGKIILGVCNGFQILTKVGLLPGLDSEYFEQKVALIQNDCGAFQNFWVKLGFNPASPCIFTRGLELMALPIRHGEGKFFTPKRSILKKLEELGCVACRYIDPQTGEPTQAFPHNPNGSLHAIAGLCDPTGRIFGLMPHPEAYLFPENDPHWLTKLPEEASGLKIFQNGVAYLRECL